MDIDRRSLLAAAAIIATGAPARAQVAPDAIPLWPAAPPGGAGPRGPETVYANGSLGNVSTPRLNVYRPSKANGAAVVVIAGGGYAHISVGVESAPTSLWLQSIGVTAFELIYRLPGEGWPAMRRSRTGSAPCAWSAPLPPPMASIRRGSGRSASPREGISRARWPSVRTRRSTFPPTPSTRTRRGQVFAG